MHVGLPRETQQIDRVMECFATRYSQCNPGLIVPQGTGIGPKRSSNSDPFPDNAYILAFSLIMLHTDAFNRSNKHKMTKADYIKNTSLPGVALEVLDVRSSPRLESLFPQSPSSVSSITFYSRLLSSSKILLI